MSDREHDEHAPDGADAVADTQWRRVRDLAQAAERLAALQAAGDLDDDGEVRLVRARLRAARAAERALLADEIADRLADLRPGASGVSANR